jgi:hypothetical protein
MKRLWFVRPGSLPLMTDDRFLNFKVKNTTNNQSDIYISMSWFYWPDDVCVVLDVTVLLVPTRLRFESLDRKKHRPVGRLLYDDLGTRKGFLLCHSHSVSWVHRTVTVSLKLLIEPWKTMISLRNSSRFNWAHLGVPMSTSALVDQLVEQVRWLKSTSKRGFRSVAVVRLTVTDIGGSLTVVLMMLRKCCAVMYARYPSPTVHGGISCYGTAQGTQEGHCIIQREI